MQLLSERAELGEAFLDGEDVDNEVDGGDASPVAVEEARDRSPVTLADFVASAQAVWADVVELRKTHIDARRHRIAHTILGVAIVWFCWQLVPLMVTNQTMTTSSVYLA